MLSHPGLQRATSYPFLIHWCYCPSLQMGTHPYLISLLSSLQAIQISVRGWEPLSPPLVCFLEPVWTLVLAGQMLQLESICHHQPLYLLHLQTQNLKLSYFQMGSEKGISFPAFHLSSSSFSSSWQRVFCVFWILHLPPCPHDLREVKMYLKNK